ncbi:MAG: CoA-binding protein [bacterium]
MASAAAIQAFVSQPALALFGASRGGNKFGNIVMRELKNREYAVFPVHPEAESIDGLRCYRSLEELPEPVGGAVISVKPEQTLEVVKAVHAAGIPRVWMQQGAESKEAIAYCEEHGIDVTSRECILMFLEPVQSIHAFHRFLRRVFGRMPA